MRRDEADKEARSSIHVRAQHPLRDSSPTRSEQRRCGDALLLIVRSKMNLLKVICWTREPRSIAISRHFGIDIPLILPSSPWLFLAWSSYVAAYKGLSIRAMNSGRRSLTHTNCCSCFWVRAQRRRYKSGDCWEFCGLAQGRTSILTLIRYINEILYRK